MRYKPRANNTTPSAATASLMSTHMNMNTRRLFLMAAMLVSLLLAVSLLRGGPAQAEEEFMDPEVAFVMSAATKTPDTADFHLNIAPKYSMSRYRLEVAINPEK